MGLSDIQAMKALKTAKQNASNVRSYVWNTDKGLRRWNVAKAKASTGNTPCILFLGDSITDGTGANGRDYGFAGLYRNAIQLASGIAGHGFICNYVFSPDNSWTSYVKGTNLTMWKATPASTSVSFKDMAKSIDVIYSTQSDGGTFTVKADGATLGTINCNGAESYHNVTTFTLGNAGTHTFQIVPATTGNTYVEGFITKSGTNTGMIVHQSGHPGIKCSDYTRQIDIVAATSAFNPSLTVIMLGTNDAVNQIPLATYQSSLDALTKQALTTGDVLIMSMADQQNGSSLTIPYASYVSTAKQVAVNNNCAYLSLYERWGSDYNWANSNGFMYDNLHPSQTGHADIAEALREVLGGFPVYGVFQIDYNALIPYGELKLANMASTFKTGSVVSFGLGGKLTNVTVTQGATSIAVSLTNEPDNSFAVSITPNWNTNWWITGKTYAGFTVNFGTSAPTGATFDWILVR